MKYKRQGEEIAIYNFAILFFICLAIAASICLRMNYRRASLESSWQDSSVSFHETKPSRLSNAVQGLMATAGGVYLSLVMLVSFLKINLPQIISIEFFRGYAPKAPVDLTVDPLALISITLAIIEPVIIRMIAFIRRINFF